MRVSRMLTVPLAIMIGSMFLLSACGSSSQAGSKGTLTVGVKVDEDSRLESAMYVAILQNAGYTVKTKTDLNNTTATPAITSGQIDLYPEFTGTGLNNLGLKGTSDTKSAYSQVKDGYKSKYQITWLDPAYNLNDSYGLCTSQAVATKYNLKSISDVTPVANKLVLTSQADAISAPDVVPAMESAYNLTFKSTTQLDEALGFGAVTSGQADVNICYTTDSNIVSQNFVLLTDDKAVFPAYNPAPIVRDTVLTAHPDIATLLNPLATKLTTSEITKLINQVATDKTPEDVVATQWLKDQGLLK